MRGYEFSVPSPYSEMKIPGTAYMPEKTGRVSVCYICPDIASSRDGPYRVLSGISEGLTDKGIGAVLFDTAGNGVRVSEPASFLDQDIYDLDRVRSYISARMQEKLGEEIFAGYGAGAVTAVSYASQRRLGKLILITPMLTWKNELDFVKKGKIENPECQGKSGYLKCVKDRDYISELEFRTVPSSDGMNVALHQLAGTYKGEIRVLCGAKDPLGTATALRLFEPYYERRGGVIDIETVQGIGHRAGLEVSQLKSRLIEYAVDMISHDSRERGSEEIEAYIR